VRSHVSLICSCTNAQRDVVDKIAAEMATNGETKAIMDRRRALKDPSPAQAAEALDAIIAVIQRRGQLLTTCVTALASHQVNFHTRIADRFAAFKGEVSRAREALAADQAAQPAEKPAAQKAVSTAAPAVESIYDAPHVEPAAPSAKKPTDPQLDVLAGLGEAGATQTSEPAKQEALARDVRTLEVDLLGLGGGAPQPAVVAPAAPAHAQEAGATDLLGGLFDAAPPNGAPKKASTEIGEGPVDLMDFGGGTRQQGGVDPLDDLFGDGPARGGSGGAESSAGFQGNGQPASGITRVNGDEAPLKKVAPRARHAFGQEFKGVGTDREALKRQFDQHGVRISRSSCPCTALATAH
jgi:hypothetical protein